jgi:thiamine-phosphate pyrophosphorylase
VPRLLAISGGGMSGPAPDGGFLAWLDGLAAAGVDGVQLREKGLDDGALLALARAARDRLPAAAALLVHRRLDVALAAGADGVHLPADGLPAAPLLAWAARLGARPLVGRSTHGLHEVEAARDEGVDYVVFGPVFATPGKGPPAGLEALAEAARLGVPVLALGGLGPERVADAIAAGAHGVAAIRAFATQTGAAAMVAAMAAALAVAPASATGTAALPQASGGDDSPDRRRLG